MSTHSRYKPIWDKLKLTGECVITTPLPLHKRIIKAVSKRKLEDLSFHLEISEARKKATLKYEVDGTMIKFILVKSIGLEDL
jgi:hypothetical protein